MLFSLANLKKRSTRDEDGELSVIPKLLHGRSALRQLEQAIALFESYIGKPRSECDTRLLEAIMGDYRLGRCVEACLLTRYSFSQPSFEDVLPPERVTALSASGISGPSDVRFAIWDAANERFGGFAPADERDRLLSDLAAEWGLPPDPALVDRLAALDSDTVAVMVRIGEPPTPQELVQQYNRGAVKTLLAHSTRVEIAASRLPGAALKRLYFIAKRSGVLVDVEPMSESGFALTLYGPEQAFGTADKYGRRLAGVSLDLIRSLLSTGDTEGAHAQVKATAHLVLYDRLFRFHITPEILELLGYLSPTGRETRNARIAETVAAYSVGSAVADEESAHEEPTFDSLVEMRLYKEYKSLEKGGYTHGWTLQREPEPVLAPGVVLIPDFGFSRGGTHIFMEIAGFWSPSYRERKVAKLKTLAAQQDVVRMILAVPHDALSIFSGLPFPVVSYKNKVVATELLDLLDRQYGGREERKEAAQSQLETLRADATSRGFIPEQEVASNLQSYTRTELLDTARDLTGDGCSYVPGVGLFSDVALEKARTTLASALSGAPDGKLDVVEAERLLCDLLGVPHVDIESLLVALEGFEIERPSLFEAYLLKT